MDEMRQAYLIADAILDRPNADPDDDQAVLARQFIRLMESTGRLLVAQRLRPLSILQPEIRSLRDGLIERISAAIDPEGAAEGRYG